jgi:hypothetical protein
MFDESEEISFKLASDLWSSGSGAAEITEDCIKEELQHFE